MGRVDLCLSRLHRARFSLCSESKLAMSGWGIRQRCAIHLTDQKLVHHLRELFGKQKAHTERNLFLLEQFLDIT